MLSLHILRNLLYLNSRYAALVLIGHRLGDRVSVLLVEGGTSAHRRELLFVEGGQAHNVRVKELLRVVSCGLVLVSGVVGRDADVRRALTVDLVLHISCRGHHSTRQARQDANDRLVFIPFQVPVISLHRILLCLALHLQMAIIAPGYLCLLLHCLGGLLLLEFGLGHLALEEDVASIYYCVIPHLFDLATARCAEGLDNVLGESGEDTVVVEVLHAILLTGFTGLIVPQRLRCLAVSKVGHVSDSSDAHLRHWRNLTMDARQGRVIVFRIIINSEQVRIIHFAIVLSILRNATLFWLIVFIWSNVLGRSVSLNGTMPWSTSSKIHLPLALRVELARHAIVVRAWRLPPSVAVHWIVVFVLARLLAVGGLVLRSVNRG